MELNFSELKRMGIHSVACILVTPTCQFLRKLSSRVTVKFRDEIQSRYFNIYNYNLQLLCPPEHCFWLLVCVTLRGASIPRVDLRAETLDSYGIQINQRQFTVL